jgi:hypothetical protein
MDALAKLQALYTKRDELNQQIQQIADLLGVTNEEPVKERKKRGPNKKKDGPPEPLKLVEPPKSKMPTAAM